jgi:CRP/FNR family transcriptional regulator
MDTQGLTALYPALENLPEAARDRLAMSGVEVRLPAGACVFDEHQSCKGFPFVLEGSIRVVKPAPSGRELQLYRVTSGETCLISTSCLLGTQAYNARGVTESDCRLLLLPTAVFESLLAEPVFRAFVFHLFADRIADLMQLIDEVAFKRLDQRLAGVLLGKGGSLKTTHQQLADELGSGREIVSRLLKGFSEQGLVRLGREQIDILDPAGLRAIASAGRS